MKINILYNYYNRGKEIIMMQKTRSHKHRENNEEKCNLNCFKTC